MSDPLGNGNGGYAEVAVLAQLGRAGGLFTYGVPPALVDAVRPGSLVRIPFTSRQLEGVVCSLEVSTHLAKVRNIADVLDANPVLTPHGIRLARWINEYYAAPLSDVIGAMLPPGLGRKPVVFLEPGEQTAGRRLTDVQRAVVELISGSKRLRQADVEREVEMDGVPQAVKSLVRRGLIIRRVELPAARGGQRMEQFVRLTNAGHALDGNDLSRAPKQRQVVVLLRERGEVPTREIAGRRVALAALEAKGLICRDDRPMEYQPVVGGRSEASLPLVLSPAQQSALSAVSEAVKAHRSQIFLLHGVTGSGKTEVYLQAIDETLRQGRQAIMMVPEISLTPQAVERVAGRFPGRVAVLHSKLSARERMDEWQRIREGAADVVVGARSALFAPLPNPGLIVVDEEHDPSYKQDASPRYNARDAAAVLGRLTGAAVMFGSATPDIGTYQAAISHRISLLELPDRPAWGTSDPPRPMPRVEIADMRQELKRGNRSIFSERLLAALEQSLNAGQQSLLFLNRRGSSTAVICRDCGYVARCPHCDIPFTHHSAGMRLICHRCDARTASPRICPGCNSVRIRYLGVGTQRVEQEVAGLFPSARVLRWDRDVTGGKDAHRRILDRFSRHEADILVGTQMIAKGLDFPLVTLVGVVSADTGLHMPDFRAPERSFQLLTQVAGRAGRSTLPSQVFIQTYTPDHYAVQAARKHDYHRFYREEMSFRQSAGYPPLSRLIRLVYSSVDDGQCRDAGDELRAALKKGIAAEGLSADVHPADVIGPAPCFVSKVKNKYFWQIIIRAQSTKSLHRLLDYVPAGWVIDVDPVDLL